MRNMRMFWLPRNKYLTYVMVLGIAAVSFMYSPTAMAAPATLEQLLMTIPGLVRLVALGGPVSTDAVDAAPATHAALSGSVSVDGVPYSLEEFEQHFGDQPLYWVADLEAEAEGRLIAFTTEENRNTAAATWVNDQVSAQPSDVNEGAREAFSPLGALDGDVTNRLPYPNYTVWIATFTPPDLPVKCPVHGGKTYNCRTYWLPEGRADDQINSRNWDTDGFMVEQPYIVERWGGLSQTWVPAFKWTKISSVESTTCFLSGRTPICEVE